jgi:hypothetical protein
VGGRFPPPRWLGGATRAAAATRKRDWSGAALRRARWRTNGAPKPFAACSRSPARRARNGQKSCRCASFSGSLGSRLKPTLAPVKAAKSDRENRLLEAAIAQPARLVSSGAVRERFEFTSPCSPLLFRNRVVPIRAASFITPYRCRRARAWASSSFDCGASDTRRVTPALSAVVGWRQRTAMAGSQAAAALS